LGVLGVEVCDDQVGVVELSFIELGGERYVVAGCGEHRLDLAAEQQVCAESDDLGH
jgi:nitroimidazol reductase NimA-like FMN-containing flavoprotein (pyridoxamine 5'-phosphate oxidase superfamily)